MIFDTRLLAYLIWGVGCLILFSIVLYHRWRAWRYHHDNRSLRDMIEGIALWIVSVASFLAITLILFGEAGTGIRGLFAGIALGSFAAVGLIMATEPRHETVKERDARR